MAHDTDSVFAANHQNGDGELHRFIMSILKEGETDEQEAAQQQQNPEVKKAKDEPAAQSPAVQTATEPQSVQQPAEQPQEQPKQQVEQPKGEVEQLVQPVQSVQADELDDDTRDLLAIKNHSIDDARKYVEQLGKDTQEIMASGMSEGAKREAKERYENAAKTLNERIEAYNAEQKAENERLRAEAERKQAQEKKEHEEKYADINYISDWMDSHKVNEENNTMLASEGFKEGAAAASGKDIFGIAKTAKEYISENTGKLATAAINDYVNGMLAANRIKEKYGGIYSYGIEPIDILVLENKYITDSVKKEFIKVRTPKEYGDNNYQSILGNAIDDFVRLFEKEYKREQGKVGKKAMEDYENIVKNPFAAADDKDAARMVFASKVLTGVDLKPMIDRAFNSIPKDRLAALTLALSKDFGYDENKAAEYIANEFQRVCLARTGAKVNSDTEAVIIGGLMNTLVGSIAQASMRSTGGGNGLTLLDAYNMSIDERAKEWAKQGMAGYGKIALRSATTMLGDSPAFGGIGKLVGSGTKWSLVRLLPRLSKGVTPKAGEAAFKLLSMTNSGRVVIGVANGAGLGAIYSPAAYSLGSLARGVTPELGEALKSSASGAVDFSMMGFTPSIMNYGADKVLKLFNGTGKAATAIRVATNIAFKDIFGPGANAALVTAKDVLLSSEKISEDLKSYYFEKFGEFLGMHVPGKLSNIRHIADEYKVRTQLNESVFTKEELRSLGYKSVKQMFDDIYAPNGKNSPGYFMKDGKAIASKLYGITVNPKVLESAKMKLLTAIGGGAIATPTITRSEIVSEYGEKGKEVYTVRTYTADGKAFSERDFGSLKDAKLEQTRLGTVIKRNNVAIAEGARDAQWMDTCSERATRAVLSELNGTATEKELTDMLKTAFEKDRNGEQLTDGEKRMLKRFDEVYLQNLRSENADNSSSVRRDFNKSRGVDIDKILAKDYYKWSESEREAVDEYIKALNGENTAKDMPSEQTEPTAPSEPPAEPANESPVVEAEKVDVEPQEEAAPEKDTEKPNADTPRKEDVGIEDYIKINKADEETANDIRDDVDNYTDEVNALRAESEQAVKYSNGESSEKPEHWDYWKEKFGLEEPKVETEKDVRPVEEPRSESEPIEPADEKPTEQPMEPKVEENPVEAEAPKEEAKADTKAEVEQAAETEPVEEVEQEQPTVDQLNQYFSHVHLGHELTEKDLGDKARMEMFTKQFLSDKEQAIKYSNGELSEKPEGYAYMKQMFDLKDPVKQPKGEETAYKKGEELVAEHDGNPMTIVVDAVGKDGNVTKSHVKSSGEPYHSNGKVVFTPKGKPQEQAVKDWVDDTASEARLQKAEDYSAFAEQYGLDAEDVAMYAEGMKKGSTSQAMRARAMIGRKIIAAHEGEIHSLMDVRKFRRPVEEALKEKFGDVDKLLEEYRNQVEDEHKAMEAAHKKAQEEEAKRKAHLEELSLLSDDEIDRRYMEALDNGNEVAARDMLDEAARRKGYADTDSEYQGVGAWVAPSNPGYESDEARRADVEDNAPNVNLEDMALGYSLQPDDYFTHPERYSQNTPHGLESARSIQAALEALKRGEKGVKVKVYRAVPISVKESKLRNGDWVTPSKKYAEMHGNSRLEGKYRIIEDEVPANELWWDGNDANEWGYDNGKEYKYKNTKNNRKLNDLVVRDDNGNVIVPSKRFNHRKDDERYQIGMEGVKPSKAEVALRDAVIGRLRESGMEVITNEEEGQRVLDEANGRAREMSFGEPYDYEAYPLGRVESNLADKEVMVVTAEADHGFMNYKEAKEWAKKNVSKVYNNEETGGKGDVRISNAAIDKFMSQSAVDKSDSKDVHLSVLKVLPEVLRTSIDVETHPDFLKGKDGKRSAENGMNKDVLVHRCYGAVEIGGKPYRVKITLKEDPRDVSFPHVTHSYEATKIELLAGTWENHEGPSPNTNNSISAAKLLENVEMSYNPSKKVLDASEKRSVGIREQRVWHSSGANFKDAKITDHIRFFRTANGEAYGFTVGGKIYIDPKIATSETPVHEYAHLWASALRSGNPKEWQNVVGLMKGTSVWEEVKKRYSELNTDDDIADEVIATYSGRRGAERLREEAHKVADGNGDLFEKAEAISALGRVKESLKKFWKGVCDFLHIHYKSAEEVADRVMKDLLDGVDPRKMVKSEAGVRFSAKQKRALETVSASHNGKHQPTVVSSADGAKILNELERTIEKYKNISNRANTFIGDVAKALGASRFGSSSEYATFEAMNGDVVTIRLANHNAHVSGFNHNGKDNGISIVISPKPNEGLINDGDAHIVEFYYDSIKLRRAEGKPLAEIVRSIKQALYSGEFKDTTGLAERQEVNGEDVVRYQLSVAGRKANGGNSGYDSKHSEIEQAVNRDLEKNSTSDEIKAEIDRVKKLRAEATKEYLSGKPHSEVAKGDAAALRERLNELNAKKTVAVENERSAKLTDKLADLNSKLIEATENSDTEKVKSLTTEIKRVKTDIGNTGIRSRYKAKISEIKSKSENVSDLAKSLVKYISGELSPILAKEMGKAEFNTLVRSVRDIAKQWNAKDGTEQDRNNLATKLDDTIRKVDDVIVGIETRKLINDLADMLSVKTTKKDSSGKKIGVKVSNTVRIAIETLKGMFRGFDGEFGNGLKSLVKSLDGMLAKKKSLQGRLKELELSEASANERLNSGAITKDEYDAEIEAINRERDDVKSEMANFDTVFSDALSETNDAIDTAVPRTTVEYDKLWNDLMAKQQDEQDGVAQMSAHDKEMLKIMPFVRSLVDVRELFAEADKSQSRLKALEEQWKSDAPTPTDTEMEAANRRDRRLQTALKIREERAKLYAAKDAARKALRDLNNDVRSLLKIGKTQYMTQQQERLEHRSEVAHIGIAAVDTGKERPAGVKGQQQAKESEEKSVGVLRRMWNWVFLAPTESAESMLSRVDVNHFSGEGELYHLIMESERGYSRSEDRRIESVEGLRSEIQSKCKELFGSKKPKDGNKRIKFTQTLSGEPVPAEVTKGEALSLYLWSLSEEGRAKLESQGIDAFSISEIKAGLGDNWVKFGEWIVGDFLSKLYDKYNEKYVEKYGTEITRHENYFPFKIYGGDIVTKDELESFDNGNTIPMPSALKERVKHSYQLSTTEDALKILNEHVAEMEDWYHFADMREDISTLLSSRAFRETLKLQGPNKWRKFRDAMHTLAGVDKRDESVTSQVINEAQSMYASSAVGFRYWTALKQLQSMIAGVNYSYNPRFQARLFANILMPVGTELLASKVKNAENTFAGMVGSCYWAWKNLPQFRERYRNGKMGNIMLEYESVVGNSNSLYRWIKKNVTQKGLFLNQVFDAAAVAVYSKSIYDYEYKRSIRKGATEEDAHKYAMTCAETNYNKTQQSSGRAYVSKMQVSGNPIEKGLTTFQTASLGFMRKSINDINDIQRAYRLLRLGKEKPLHSISKGAKATVDLLCDGVVMPASWNLINVIGVAGFYYGAKAIFNALFGGDDDNAPTKDATGKTALDRFIEGHAGDVAFATISAPLQGTILNNFVNSVWSGYGGWTPTMAEGAISEVLRSVGETLKGYKDSDSLSDYLDDLDEDAAKYTIKTVLYALFRGYTGIDMKTVERFYNAFYDYKVKGSSLNLISAANFLSTPMSSMRDHEAKDYYLGAYGKTSETAKDLEDYIVKRAYADGKIFKREVESGGARGKVAELFRSRAFKRDLNKYVDEWAEYHIRDASDAADYHDEWLKNHERKEIIRKNRELEYSDEQAKQKTDSLKLALGYEQKSGNSERTLRHNLVQGILRQIKKKLTGGDKERREAFALMKELERIDKVQGHTHSDYVKLAEKAGVNDFQMIPKGVSESGKYVNKSDIDNGTVARGEVKGSYGIIATADDVKADARLRKLHDSSEKQKAEAKEVMKMYSDGDIGYQDAYRRMTAIGDGLVTAVYASEADRLIKDLKTKLTKAVKAGDDKAADAIMEKIRSIRGKVIDGDMKSKEEVAKMLLNSIR
ncbi:hypothetical protein [uncultured Prevotella sp.]|uniref:LPD3 domain-containing protein n=1 Tax=uncultured Prevotella sp. TaxID=159272 RepID=UPI0027E32930|nr:hypothetical protein [uncultured Prevotella sp.]